MYYRGAACAVICFDSTRRQTADNVKNWVKDLQHHADEEILVAINCTKTDLLRESTEWRTFIKNHIKDSSKCKNFDSVSSADRTGSLSSFSSALTGSNGSTSVYSSEATSQISPLSECDSQTQSESSFGFTGLYSDPRHPCFEMIQYAKSINAIYIETSSKENEGIDDMFLTIGRRLIDSTRRRRKNDFGYASPTGNKSRYSDDIDNFLNGDMISTSSSSYTVKASATEKQSGGCCGLGSNNTKPTNQNFKREESVIYVKTGRVDDRYR